MEKKVSTSTHVEVVCKWVINHLNKFHYIGMFQHFHYGYLQVAKQAVSCGEL